MAAIGLLNPSGANNCFLNVAVEALYHLEPFRTALACVRAHRCTEDACILCALGVLFANLDHTEFNSLPPDALRAALARAHSAAARFQLQMMDDAIDCFVAILCDLHTSCAAGVVEENCNSPACPTHAVFAVDYLEEVVCPRCKRSFETAQRRLSTLYASAVDLMSANGLPSSVRGTMCALASTVCPKCHVETRRSLTALQLPSCLCVGLVRVSAWAWCVGWCMGLLVRSANVLPSYDAIFVVNCSLSEHGTRARGD
eukprot:m.68390 g.68390  ORF g.68390 m.68390 type:complete len:257 (-) comp7496_c0_seq2:22-792(-)